MGFEPTTFCLGSRHSTPELHPPHCSRLPEQCRIDPDSNRTGHIVKRSKETFKWPSHLQF